MLSLAQYLDPDNADAANVNKIIEAFELLLGTRSKVEVEVVISPTDNDGPLGLENANLAPMINQGFRGRSIASTISKVT